MIKTAFASAYHWSKIGKPINDARADVTLAHVHSLLGLGEGALFHARRSLVFCEKNECEDWDLAFAHAEMAFAAAVLGDRELHAKHYTLAKQRGEAIKEEEDRKVFMEEFSRIPSET